MIRNLNQVSFQGYGTILPERAHAAKIIDKGERQTITLDQGDALVYRAVSEVWLNCGTGMTILSVSSDGETYYHFYLDKPVCVKSGITFSLAAFRGASSAEMAAGVRPESLGTRPTDSLLVKHRMRVDGLYTFFYHEKEQGFLFPGESHPMMELTYVDQGSLHSVADGQDLLLKQGDIAIYGPNQWHMQYADIGVAPRYVTISFDLSGDELKPLLNRKYTAPQQAVSLLQQMLREQERMDAYSKDMILSQLNMLLLLLLRQTESPTGAKLQTSNAVHSENEIVRQAQQFISTHIREKLSVPLVARQVDVSPSYLTALFHKNLQISPGEYIRRIKLQESKQMIRENDLNFTEIAAALQYSTVHHFSRQFKEKFGITPTEYAKSVR
ncbi:MAG: helix-turn-helix transcriptional regulator [Oscillospiraceae bacterium]|nr:helix-turn-helix transcriptional regulator [Oscillospiraceae bacterium]